MEPDLVIAFLPELGDQPIPPFVLAQIEHLERLAGRQVEKTLSGGVDGVLADVATNPSPPKFLRYHLRGS